MKIGGDSWEEERNLKLVGETRKWVEITIKIHDICT